MHKSIAILGGTFDPIHKGHLAICDHILAHKLSDHIHLVPCHTNPLKQSANVTANDRLEMIQLAIADRTHYQLNPIELNSKQTTYTVNTLQNYREHYPESPLLFIMGMDCFNQLPQWKHWQQLLDYAHLVIFPRAHDQIVTNATSQTLLQQHQTTDTTALQTELAGKIYLLNIKAINIASTDLRHKIAKHEDVSDLVPTAVWDYIQQHALYR